MSKQIIKMKQNIKMMKMVKKLATKVIHILLVAIMSSQAFAGTYYINNLSEAPALIKADVEKQEDITNIIYNGTETFSSKSDAVNMITSLDDQSKAILKEFDLQNIFNTIVKGSTTDLGTGAFKVKVGQYDYEYKNSESDLVEVDKIIENVITQIQSTSNNNYETIKAIYEYVINTYHYQKLASSDTDFPNVMNERNILLGLQGNGVVCDAYAMLMCRMLDKAGLENKFVSGTIQGGLHVWNIVKLEGKWYHVDATWGDGSQNYLKKYLLAGDNNISDYHVWDKLKYPTTATTAYDPTALGNEILGKLQTIESQSYITIDDVDTALSSLDLLKVQANEVADTTLKGKVIDEVSRIEAYLNQLKSTIGANNEAELIQKATLAVETAERTLSVDDYTNALSLVTNLADETTKTELLNRLDVVKKSIDTQEELKAIQKATQAVEIAEGSLLDIDYNVALSLVNDLKDSSNKTDLVFRLNAIKELINTQEEQLAIQKATQAVEIAESSLLMADYNSALTLVNGLKESYYKEDLLSRLDIVLMIIEMEEEIQAFEKATQAVEQAESSLSLTDYHSALTLVEALNDCDDKTDLLDRLATVKTSIDNQTEAEKDELALKQATEAVVKAENTLSFADYNTALNLVNALKDSSEKTTLLDRLEIVNQTIIVEEENKAVQKATEAVVKAESTLTLADYSSALSLVNALNDSPAKTGLLNRLEAVKKSIDEQNTENMAIQMATEAVVKAEKSLLLTDYTSALSLVNALEDSTIKTGLLSRLEAVKKAIDDQNNENIAIQMATEAVVKAEKTLLLTDHNSALSLVNALNDSPTKTGLLNRLEAVKKAIDDQNKEDEDNTAIQIATQAVVKAEQSLLLTDYNSALSLVNALNDSPTKTGLLNRLEAVKKAINDQNKEDEDNTAIQIATDAVVKAEKSLLLTDYTSALSLVNALENSSAKTSLLSRLEAVKKAIDDQNKEENKEDNSIEEATQAVIKAERTLSLSDYKSALSLVKALDDSTTKTKLLSRLEAVKEAIDEEEEADEEYKATKAVKTAEISLDEDDYDYALKLVKRLSKGSVKTRLLNRLEAVKDQIDNLSNSVQEATKPVINKQAINNKNVSDILALYAQGYKLGSIYAKGNSNKINGFISNPASANSVNNRNMLFLPIGTVANVSGYSVYSDTSGNITLTNGTNTAILKANQFIYNGETMNYQIAPIKRNGTSYINAEFLVQYLGAEVSFFINGSSIIITVY